MIGEFNKTLDFSVTYGTPQVVGEADGENSIHKLALTASDKHTYVPNYTKWVISTVPNCNCGPGAPFEILAQQLGENCRG